MKPSVRSQLLLGGFGFLFAVIGTQATAATSVKSVPDTLEQRLAACAECHGESGRGIAEHPKVPRLAGKPAGYLYKQLQAFKNGQSPNSAMAYVVRQLSPEYMQTIARYYASQQVPYTEQKLPKITEQELARGEELAKHGDPEHGVPACQRCHGNALTGVTPMIPGIINQPYDYTHAQLDLWRSNTRSIQSTHCMWVVATRMKQSDVKAVSAWLASQKPPANPHPITVNELSEPLPEWCRLEHSGVDTQ
ncbi:Cytochrome c, monohaem domain [gamma proteobacterium HdN1]|nr:Cytochrome c, monohaem domain [gamma proteobacterium HdN1]